LPVPESNGGKRRGEKQTPELGGWRKEWGRLGGRRHGDRGTDGMAVGAIR